MSKLQTKTNELKLKIEANQPKIMVYSGIGMMASGTAMAVVATNKLPERLDKLENQKFSIENGELTGEDQVKALTKAKLNAYGRIALDYAPAVGLTIAGSASILGGLNIINKRLAGVTAALATTTEAFNKYRAAVVENYGEEVDYRLRHNIKEEETVDEEGNTQKKITFEESQYARVFSKSTTPEWKEDPGYNYAYIKNCENYVNSVLQARNHVFLNEVYDQLGMDRTEAGAVVGWVYKNGGDGYIDFGIEKFKEFIDGETSEVLLDFNVDGVIFDVFNK